MKTQDFLPFLEKLFRAAEMLPRLDEIERRLNSLEQGKNLKLFSTEKELAKEYGLNERTIRGWRSRASVNGLQSCILRRGRKVLYDRARFRQWVEQARGQLRETNL
ncbi:MAG: hypothetical protein SF066_06415 [Thermoanaerobaculia bacterium]|nr:hypothetical protein [Thermoanaerobaculia bacterium]